MDERRAIELLRRELGSRSDPGVLLGIGDDAAVLAAQKTPLVWSVDTSMEGVHFDLRWLSVGQAAARAFVAALSDLAAMGAAPVAALCAVGLPEECRASDITAIGRGQAEVAERYACPVVGGNLTRDLRWSFTTTVLGSVPHGALGNGALGRGGARAGDQLWVIGELGAAAAGRQLLSDASSGRRRRSKAAAREHCIDAWRSPRAELTVAQTLRTKASALIDVSDGLASEAGHLSRSSGCKVVLVHELLLDACSDELACVAEELAHDPVDWMLYGGEDYALLGAGPELERPPRARPLGWFEPGHGVWLVDQNGRRRRVEGGFDHLRA